MGIGPHRTHHQHMLRPRAETGQRGVDHQRIVGMDKRLFTARFTAGRARAAKNNIDRIGDLRQRIGQLRIVGIIDAGISASGRRVGAAMEWIFGSLSNIRSKCPPTNPVAPVIST